MFKRFFGSHNVRALARTKPLIKKINILETKMKALSDEALKGKTETFKKRLAASAKLESLLPEAFAVVREASRRTIGLRHHDVQLIGGIILHEGKIAEMRTGEGKTLAATLPAYLNALSGKGVHIVTVNDYLAKRDTEWMGKIYRFLELTVGCIQSQDNDGNKQKAYQCDISYGTNNEFGFDYLRDNMKFNKEHLVQRPFYFALVDEVDNILIDEARTPLIISGAAEESSELYRRVNDIIPSLQSEHYEKEEKNHQITLTESGNKQVEALLRQHKILEKGDLYDLQNVSLVHHVQQALRAHHMYSKDKDYIIRENQVVLIDEFTGRMMEGRRFSEGLHQALEAKEKVHIQLENQTLASITFQNYFRMYPKLAGMTGTAETEAEEFQEIYGLETVVIPTFKPIVRADHEDEIYRTAKEKYQAISTLVKACRKRQQPVLLGTATIAQSEFVSTLLTQEDIPHNVLNARFHQKEAEIISQAGCPGAVTIATNMAGRGTDIQLGGNLEMRLVISFPESNHTAQDKEKIASEIAAAKEKVLQAGGVYVIGTERHESRRIDNQLRGRSGRQGDPGASKFFLSLEDDLMRIFGAQDRLGTLLQKLGLEEGEAITHPWVTKSLERAQKKVEARNFDIRKQLLKYDDVMNDQRTAIYAQRQMLLENKDISKMIQTMRTETIKEMVVSHIPENSLSDQWQTQNLSQEVTRVFNLNLPVQAWAKEEGVADQEIQDRIITHVNKMMAEKEEKVTSKMMRYLEKATLLKILDTSWKDHLRSIDVMRQYIHLRAYGQRNPLNEFKNEAFIFFAQMMDDLKVSVTQMLSLVQADNKLSNQDIDDILLEENTDTLEALHPEAARVSHLEDTGSEKKIPLASEINAGQDMFQGKAIRRNDPCPCGSGKRFKHCHGR